MIFTFFDAQLNFVQTLPVHSVSIYEPLLIKINEELIQKKSKRKNIDLIYRV